MESLQKSHWIAFVNREFDKVNGFKIKVVIMKKTKYLKNNFNSTDGYGEKL